MNSVSENHMDLLLRNKAPPYLPSCTPFQGLTGQPVQHLPQTGCRTNNAGNNALNGDISTISVHLIMHPDSSGIKRPGNG